MMIMEKALWQLIAAIPGLNLEQALKVANGNAGQLLKHLLRFRRASKHFFMLPLVPAIPMLTACVVLGALWGNVAPTDSTRPGLAFASRVRTVAGPGSREPGARAYVAHRDRLCRFAFELLEDMLRRCGAAVVADSHAAGADGEPA